MSTKSTAVFCLAGVTVVILCAVIAATDPVVKYHATNAGILVLAVLALGGILARLLAPLAHLWATHTSTDTRAVSAPQPAPTAGPARHTGTLR